jgi:hypothetical protein
MKLEAARRFALSLPGTTEEPHHEMSSLRVEGRIYATVTPDHEYLHVFVDHDEIERMVATDPDACERLHWGSKIMGLRIRIAEARSDMLEELLYLAWRRKAPKSIVDAFDFRP